MIEPVDLYNWNYSKYYYSEDNLKGILPLLFMYTHNYAAVIIFFMIVLFELAFFKLMIHFHYTAFS